MLLRIARPALLLALLFLCMPVWAQSGALPQRTPIASVSSLDLKPPVQAIPSQSADLNAGVVSTRIDKADTAWTLLGAALVLLMTPGLAFFYGGLTRSKNVMSTFMMSFVAMGIVSIQWMLFGYSLAFGTDIHGIIGDPMQYFGLRGVGAEPRQDIGQTIPQTAFMIFQMAFAVITPALISGAVVERIKFGAYCLFILLWSTFVYDPLVHMVWGGGWLAQRGVLDFAGGTVVETASGVSALVMALMLGKRRGLGSEELRPHNLPMVLIGAGILWFGWFGFNAGSTLAVNSLAAQTFINTHIAGAAAALVWMLIEWVRFKKPSALGFASGAIAGLVAITPACGFVDTIGAVAIGAGAAFISFYAILLKSKLDRYDDSLDVFAVHGCAGMFGLLATGLFANALINPAITHGLNGQAGILANGHSIGQLGTQLLAVAVTASLAIVLTLVTGKIAGVLTGGLRATADEEENGLDVTEHGEAGYSTDAAGTAAYAVH